MSDLKKSIIKNILDKKFNKANDDFASLMKDKTHSAIQDFKSAFKYTKLEPETETEPTETQPEGTTNG
tara:strand:- start:120 stop:323 length:204 start_codon:yes stop_codon:yes gene_type:complete